MYVNTKALYKATGATSPYSTRLPVMIAWKGFIEGVDYVKVCGNGLYSDYQHVNYLFTERAALIGFASYLDKKPRQRRNAIYTTSRDMVSGMTGLYHLSDSQQPVNLLIENKQTYKEPPIDPETGYYYDQDMCTPAYFATEDDRQAAIGRAKLNMMLDDLLAQSRALRSQLDELKQRRKRN